MNAPGTALVTGGARRIGRAIVEDLARNGFGVVIHCNHSHADAFALAEAIVADGGNAAVERCDLTEPAQLQKLIGRASSHFGTVRLLVNNASTFQPDTAADFNWERWNQHFDVHVKAPVQLTRDFAAALPPGETGLVVNIVDQRVWKPTPLYFSYALSKSALWNATKTLAQTFAPNIRVNAIGPGPTLANVRQNQTDFDAQAKTLLLGRGPELGEFGAAIRYLWDSQSVTGQMIAIDGGQHLAWQTPDTAGNE